MKPTSSSSPGTKVKIKKDHEREVQDTRRGEAYDAKRRDFSSWALRRTRGRADSRSILKISVVEIKPSKSDLDSSLFKKINEGCI